MSKDYDDAGGFDHPASKPSQLAQNVTKAFKEAAQDEITANLKKDYTVVGEADGVFRGINRSMKEYQDGSIIKDPSTSTIRYDGGKKRVDLIPVKPLEAISEVLTVALQKYPENNWLPGMNWSRCYGSTLRHLLAWWSGEDLDQQTHLSHLAHAACNILFLLDYEIRKRGTDDRPKY